MHPPESRRSQHRLEFPRAVMPMLTSTQYKASFYPIYERTEMPSQKIRSYLPFPGVSQPALPRSVCAMQVPTDATPGTSNNRERKTETKTKERRARDDGHSCEPIAKNGRRRYVNSWESCHIPGVRKLAVFFIIVGRETRG